jgi:hypothetical protein
MAKLKKKEYVLNDNAVANYGVDFMNSINNLTFDPEKSRVSNLSNTLINNTNQTKSTNSTSYDVAIPINVSGQSANNEMLAGLRKEMERMVVRFFKDSMRG